MKVSDLLRRMADQMDLAPESTVDQTPNQARMAAVKIDQDDKTAPETMVAPLQQELELMKKAAGVPSAFDSEEEMEEPSCGCGGTNHDHSSASQSDLDALRQIAGIKIVR